MKKKIVIFGGSFNPPHIGHYKVVELIRDTFKCDEIWLMPSGHRKDKKMQATDTDRIAFAEIMATELKKENAPSIHVSTIEIDRGKLTATIDTLRELKLLHPDHEFYFVVSSELIPHIRTTWDEGDELFSQTNFIVVERPGSHKIEDIELPPLAIILRHPEIVPEISSTHIRNITLSDDLKKWTSPHIADHIVSHKIYGFGDKN